MAFPDPGVYPASWDLDDNSTQGRAVSDTLWPMLCSRRRILEEIPMHSKIDQPLFEIIYEQPNPKYVTAKASTNLNGSATNARLDVAVADFAMIQPGAVLRNMTRPTPIGTYDQNECLLVTTKTGTEQLTVIRNCFGAVGGTNDNGSLVHENTDKFEILYSNIGEASLAADQPNMYKLTNRVYNYISGFGFLLSVTGDAFARGMLHVKDTLARQYTNRMLELENQLVSAILYSGYQSTAVGIEGGSDAALSFMKGVEDWMCQSGGNIDHATTTLTYDAIDALFTTIVQNGGDVMSPYIIVTNPRNVATISHFEEDRVRITQDSKRVGRQIREFMSTSGPVAPIIPEPMCNPNDLFVIDTSRWSLVPFRPFEAWEWGAYTATPTGDDIWRQRVLGKFTLEFVDALKCHGVMKTIGSTTAYGSWLAP